MEATYEPLPCSEPAMEANYEPAEETALRLSALSVTAEEAVSEHSVSPVPVSESKYGLSTCSVFTNMSVTPSISPHVQLCKN